MYTKTFSIQSSKTSVFRQPVCILEKQEVCVVVLRPNFENLTKIDFRVFLVHPVGKTYRVQIF